MEGAPPCPTSCPAEPSQRAPKTPVRRVTSSHFGPISGCHHHAVGLGKPPVQSHTQPRITYFGWSDGVSLCPGDAHQPGEKFKSAVQSERNLRAGARVRRAEPTVSPAPGSAAQGVWKLPGRFSFSPRDLDERLWQPDEQVKFTEHLLALVSSSRAWTSPGARTSEPEPAAKCRRLRARCSGYWPGIVSTPARAFRSPAPDGRMSRPPERGLMAGG